VRDRDVKRREVGAMENCELCGEPVPDGDAVEVVAAGKPDPTAVLHGRCWLLRNRLRSPRNGDAGGAPLGAPTQAGHPVDIELTDEERDLLRGALFDLRITHAIAGEKGAQIEALVAKLGGDPETALFGAFRDSREDGPVPDYPADESDEG
jgi:hypothetical protein